MGPYTCDVLIVSTDTDLADSVAMVLESEGMKSICARTGSAALDLLATERPRVVLSDMNCGDMTSDELRNRAADVPWVIMSGSGRFQSSGPGRLRKPFGARELEAVLGPHLPRPIG